MMCVTLSRVTARRSPLGSSHTMLPPRSPLLPDTTCAATKPSSGSSSHTHTPSARFEGTRAAPPAPPPPPPPPAPPMPVPPIPSAILASDVLSSEDPSSAILRMLTEPPRARRPVRLFCVLASRAL